MKKCLFSLAVLFLAFNAGYALRCYECKGDACRDPYSGNGNHEVTCLLATHCGKRSVDNGAQVVRGCALVSEIKSSAEKEQFKGFQDVLDGKAYDNVIDVFCKDNLCNGSGRLAEISTKMILLPATLLLLISFFSRL